MPAKKRAAARTAKRRRPARGARSKTSAPKGLLIDVARSVGSTLGTLAARSSQAAERLRAAAAKKRS